LDVVLNDNVNATVAVVRLVQGCESTVDTEVGDSTVCARSIKFKSTNMLYNKMMSSQQVRGGFR
jgi:hypothetical protein